MTANTETCRSNPIGRKFRSTILLGCALVLVLPLLRPAAVEASSGTSGFTTPALSDAELAMIRGGFRVAGMDLDFGAIVHTYVEGRLALETVLTPASDGSWVTDSVQSHLPPGSGWTQVSPGTPFNGDPTLAGIISGSAGIVRSADGKTTAVLHMLSSGGPANVIINEVAGSEVAQSITLNLGIGNYAGAVQELNRLRTIEFGRIGQNELVQALAR